jgi:hypothetical protein
MPWIVTAGITFIRATNEFSQWGIPFDSVLSYLPPKDIRPPLRGSSWLAHSGTGEMRSVQNLSRNTYREQKISDPCKWT